MSWTRAEKVELGLVLLSTVSLYSVAHHLPRSVNLGWVVASLALVLLIQGFFRDLWLLYRERRRPTMGPKLAMRCMCLESTVGAAGILLGGVLALGVSSWNANLSPATWAALGGATMLFGLLTKDLIITLNPLGLRRDPNHHNIIFR